jgi:hypothetical protein
MVVAQPRVELGRRSPWQVRVRSQLELPAPAEGLHGAIASLAGFRFSSAWMLEAGALVSGTAGVLGRVVWSPGTGALRPAFALEVPLLFTAPASVGFGASVGAEYQLTPWCIVTAEVPAYILAAAPARVTKRAYLFGALSVAFRY